jgi:hypothetical protein
MFPKTAYQFSIKRPNLPPVNVNTVIDQNNTGTLLLVITSEKPVTTILKPVDNSVWRRFEITFEGNGTDYEDGELSGNSLVWYSGINGMLGTGNTLTTDRLSIGKHMITLTTTDSDKKTDRKNITVVVIDYNPDSYFPISEKTTWEYRYLNPTFSFINSNNVTELWTIKNLSVLIDNMKRRISTVYYDITIASVTNHLKYTIIDNLEEVDNDIYVVSTSEKMIEWKEGIENENNPHLTLDITTEYSPDYLIIKDITNPIKVLPLEFIVKTTTEWSSKYYNIVQEYHDTEKDLVTKIEAGNSRYIQTDKGVFKATELVITTPDSKRTWWLTKSVGIIASESTTHGVDNTAILVDSDLTDYYRDDTSTQTRPVVATGKPYPVKILHINRESGEGLMELRNFLRSMAP